MTPKNDLRVLFMGTTDFSVKVLDTLSKHYNVIGAVTRQDKPKGRKYVLTPSPVKVFATENGIDIFQPSTLRNDSFKETLTLLNPELIVVVAYGLILPKYVLDYPELGCINVHASLLPLYRGAAPIQRAIINGEKTTGITTMLMDEGLDTGDILEQEEIPIGSDDNFETVTSSLSDLSSKLIISTIEKLRTHTIIPSRQDDDLSTYADKITNDDCLIDFSKDSYDIHNQIRALSPTPSAFTFVNGKRVKIVKSSFIESDNSNASSGEILAVGKEGVFVKCGKGCLIICEVIPEGKKLMPARDFINGYRKKAGDLFN